MGNKIEYKKAFKNQIVTAIAALTLFFILIYISMQPKINIYLFSLISLMILGILFAVLKIFKEQAKEAKCPHCETDLFEMIQVASHEKVDFNYCPTCGNNVEL